MSLVYQDDHQEVKEDTTEDSSYSIFCICIDFFLLCDCLCTNAVLCDNYNPS